MKIRLVPLAIASLPCLAHLAQAAPIHVTHLWHMHQPIYYPYESVRNTDANGRFNFNVEGNVWDGDRYSCYRDWPAGAVGRAQGHGASQMSYSGSLAENNKVIWGDYGGWAGNVRNARNNMRTSSNNSRLDLVGIAYHHSLMPLTCVESMRMQIKLHKEQYKEAWDTGGAYSKGFWPPECAFDSSMIPALVAEGLEWVIVDNGHLFRTISDFEWSSGSSCRPNRADVRNGSSTNLSSTWVGLQNVWAPTKVLAPWSYQPHYARHVDPWTGEIRKIIAVPAGRYEGNENGRGGYGAFKPENVWGSHIGANNNASKPMLLLCHSDGDNYGMKNSDAWNGQQQAFVDMCAGNADFEYTGVQDYLGMFPPDPNDVIHVEPGSWIGIDGGTPYYEKWLSYETRDGEMPDMWSWSVLVAAQNRVLTADDMENSYLSGSRDLNDVEWGIGNDTARAWHFYLNGETSCYWYWDFDRANPWDGNVTLACNLANAEAMKVIGRNPSGDSRGPSIFPPQRIPYNPGGKMWNETEPAASDFQVWSFVDDVNGVQSAKLYWRKDDDGHWPINAAPVNETYAGGPGVGAWQSVAMTNQWWPASPGPKIPAQVSARVQRYMGSISGQTNCLIDYFVEAVDARGNTNRSNIIHVWVGEQSGGSGEGGDTNVSVWIRGTHSYPVSGDATDGTPVFVNAEAGPSGAVSRVALGISTNDGASWALTNMTPNASWGSVGGQWFNVSLGLFPANTTIKYYVEATDGVTTNWDNNRNQNYSLLIAQSGGQESLWVGNSSSDGAGTSFVVDCESWPVGAASNVSLIYSVDGGATWLAAPFAKTGEANNNDLWRVDLGAFSAGTIVHFCISAAAASGLQAWDNNGGQNYSAVLGETGALRLVFHAPTISAAGSPDNPDDVFDFDLSGGSATTSGSNGFGSFGRIYVNCDSNNVYVGATGVALPNDSQNNAFVVFLGGGTNSGVGNLWSFSGAPDALDGLHNVAFQPEVGIAILLGDVWGDGTFPDFRMYKDDGFQFGQGIFSLDAGDGTFVPVPGAALSQFGGYGPESRLASNWECSIPFSAFGVSSASALTNLYLSGLMVTGDKTGDNRFVSGKFLGQAATLGNGESPDEWGNFAFSFVNLSGLKVNPLRNESESFGVPNSWIAERLPQGHPFGPESNYDGDRFGDRAEFFLGTDPMLADDLSIVGISTARMAVAKSGGQISHYVLQTADQLVNSNWNWTTRSTLSSTNGDLSLPLFASSNLLFRVKVVVPE